MSDSAASKPESGDQRYSREGCECDRLGRSENVECVHDDPCPTHVVTRSAATKREHISVAAFAHLRGLDVDQLRWQLQIGKWWNLEYDSEKDTVANVYGY